MLSNEFALYNNHNITTELIRITKFMRIEFHRIRKTTQLELKGDEDPTPNLWVTIGRNV